MKLVQRLVSLAALAALGIGIAVVGQAPSHGNPPGSGGGGTPLMGRLRTIGFEAEAWSTGFGGAEFFEGVSSITGGSSAATETVKVHGGGKSLKITGGSTSGPSAIPQLYPSEQAVGRTYFTRAYMMFEHLPNTTVAIFRATTGGAPYNSVDLTAAGVLRHSYWDNGLGAGVVLNGNIGTIELNRWYRLELRTLFAVGSNDEIEVRIDGVSVSSAASLNISDVAFRNIQAGWVAGNQGSGKVVYVDDIAINDDVNAGSGQQISWPGEGKIVLLKPISDNAVGTGWVDGDGAGTLFGSVDNTPPVGVGTAANGTQIKNLTSTATGNYDANCATYANAGIVAGDVITVVQAVCDHSEDVATATKNGALQIVSNPAQSGEDTFVYGDDVGANGTWPVFWRAKWGTAQYLPAVTLTTSPVVRVGKRTATTRQVDVDFLGIMVEYMISSPGPPLLPLLGVQ